MIVGQDTHPEKTVYYVGALVLEILNTSPRKNFDFLDTYQETNKRYKVSMNLFILTMDWLFLLGAVHNKDGFIEKCF